MPAVEIATLGAFPKEIIQLVKLGLFSSEIVVESLKHGLFRFDLHGSVLDSLQSVRWHVGLFFVVVVGLVHRMRCAVAGLHDEHHGGECRGFQKSSKPFVRFHSIIF